MKLHLPKPLRNSVLACIAAVAGIATPTLGTATFAGGVVAFTLATQQAMAETYTVTVGADDFVHNCTFTAESEEGGTATWSQAASSQGAQDHILHFTTDSTDAENVELQVQYSTFCVGGVITDAGAGVAMIKNNGTRTFHLGKNGSTTASVINNDFTFSPNQGMNLYGTQTWTVAQNKTLTFTGANVTNSGVIALDGAGSVDFTEKTISGSGSIAVNSGTLKNALFASGATLTLGDGGKLSGVTMKSGSILDLKTFTLSSSKAAISTSAVTVESGMVVELTSDVVGKTVKLFDASVDNVAFMIDGQEVISARSDIQESSGAYTITSIGSSFDDMVWAGGASGTWSTSSTNQSWNSATGGDGIAFANGDTVTFASSATVGVDGAVEVAGMTVSGAETELSMTRSNNGYIKGDVLVTDGAKLIIGSETGGSGFVRGSIEVADGTLQFNAKDVTGYDGGANSTQNIKIASGSTLVINHNSNETFAGTLTLNGTMEGTQAGSRWDLFGGSAAINVDAGASAEIKGVNLQTRQDDSRITVGNNATLKVGQITKGAENKNGTFIKAGAGTLVLGGAVSTTGGLTVESGTVEITDTINLGGTLSSGVNTTIKLVGTDKESTVGSIGVNGGAVGGQFVIGATNVLNAGSVNFSWNRDLVIDGVLNVTGDAGFRAGVGTTTMKIEGSGTLNTTKLSIENYCTLDVGNVTLTLGAGGLNVTEQTTLALMKTVSSAGNVTLNGILDLRGGTGALTPIGTGSYTEANNNGFYRGSFNAITTEGEATLTLGTGFVLKVAGVTVDSSSYEVDNNDLIVKSAGTGTYFINNGPIAATNAVVTTTGFTDYYVAAGQTLTITTGDSLSEDNARTALLSANGPGTVSLTSDLTLNNQMATIGKGTLSVGEGVTLTLGSHEDHTASISSFSAIILDGAQITFNNSIGTFNNVTITERGATFYNYDHKAGTSVFAGTTQLDGAFNFTAQYNGQYAIEKLAGAGDFTARKGSEALLISIGDVSEYEGKMTFREVGLSFGQKVTEINSELAMEGMSVALAGSSMSFKKAVSLVNTNLAGLELTGTASTINFEGAMSGGGNFIVAVSPESTTTFSGDVSGWNAGNIRMSNSGTIVFTGAATNIVAGLIRADDNGNLKLKFDNTVAVTVGSKLGNGQGTMSLELTAGTHVTGSDATTVQVNSLILGKDSSLLLTEKTLTFDAGKSLVVNGAGTLGSALVLQDCDLTLGGALNLNSNALTLDADHKGSLTMLDGMVTEESTIVNLITGISTLNGVTLTKDSVLGDLFLVDDTDLAGVAIRLSEGNLQLVFGGLIPDNVLYVSTDGLSYDSAEVTEAMDTILLAGGRLTMGDTAVASALATLDVQGSGAIVGSGSVNEVAFTQAKVGGALSIEDGDTDLTVKLGGLTITDGGSISVAAGQVLDLTAIDYKGETGAFADMLNATSGAGKVLAKATESVVLMKNATVNTNVVMSELELNSWQPVNSVLTLSNQGSLTIENQLIVESTAKIVVAGGELEAGSIRLGHSNGSTHAGHLAMSAGSIKTDSITKTASTGSTIQISGGTLELTGTGGIASGIATTITGGTLVADTASWDITGATIGGATVTDGTLNCAVQIQTTGDNTITLTNATLTGTLDNTAGKLMLAGATNITSDGYKKVETPTAYKYGENGYATTDTYYQLVTTADKLTTVSGATFTVDGSQTAISLVTDAESDWYKWVKKAGTEYGTVYYVRDGAVTYNSADDQFATATKLLVNGGSLTLETSLAGTVSENIRVETPLLEGGSYAATLTIGKDATLGLNQLSVKTGVKLAGTGVYDIASEKALRNGVQLDAAWEGTVKLTGSSLGGINLDNLGNAASTKDSVEFCGVSGHLSQNGTYSTNLILTNGADDAPAWSINNGWDGDERTFTGTISGTGDIQRTAAAGTSQTFIFAGDISQWSGMVKNYTTKNETKFNITGSTEIKASFDSYGSDNVRYDLQLAIDDATIAESVTDKTVVVTGSVNVSSLTLGFADDTADSRATVKLNNSVTADTLNNYAATTVNGTLAAGAAVTNNGTLTLTQDTASLASLAGTGSVTAKSLTLTGADNAISSLKLSTGLTLGVAAAGDDAGVVSSLAVTTLTVDNTNKMGLVTINNLNAVTPTTPAILKAGSLAGSLTFAFDDALLEEMVGATDAKSLVLMEITDGKSAATELLLKAFGESTDPAATSQISRDQRYTYSLKWDAVTNQLKLEAQLCGVYWNGANAPEDPALWTENSSWATSVGASSDDAPSDTVAAVLSGHGDGTIFVKGAADTLSLTVDVWHAFREAYDLQSYNGSGFFTPDAGVEDKLTIAKNLVVNAGALNVMVDTEVKGDLVVKSNGRFFNHDGDKRENEATSLQVKGNLDNAGTLFKNHMGATLTVEGKATNSGTLDNGTALTGQETTAGSGDAIITIAGQLTNTGAITNGEAGKLTIGSITGYDPEGSDIVNTGVITNAGTLAAARDMANSGVYTQTDGSLYVGGNLTNTGVASVENPAAGMNITGGKVTVGTMTNNGTLNLSDASLELNGYSYTAAPGPVSTLKPIVQAAELVNAGTMNITDGAQVKVNTITVGKQTAVGTVTNTGEIKVTEGSLTTSTMDNDGTLTIGGAKDAEGNVLASVKVTGGLDNTAGNIVIGSAATETDKATYGSLSVGGNLTHAGNGNIVVNSGSSLDVKGDLAANGMTLDFDGVVTVGGNAVVNNLTNDGTFTADNATIGTLANNGTLSVGEVGAGGNLIGGKLTITTLTGTGAVNVGKDGSLTITDAAEFSGQLNNQGKLELKGATLSAAQAEGATAGNITTEIVTVKSTATGYNGGSYVMGDIKTDALVIEDIDAADTAARLDMNSLAAKTTDGVVSITISDADMAAVVAAGKGSYDLISVGSVLSGLNLTNNDDLTTAYMQALLANGLNMELLPSEAAATAAVAAAVKTVVKLNVREQTADESIWNFDGAHNTTEAGLIVLKDGKLASDVVLDKVQTVKVTDSQSLDMTGDISKVTLNGLTAVNADSSVAQKLTITGDAGDTATVTTAASGYAGTVVLDKVSAAVSGELDTVKLTNKAAANLAVTNTDVEALTSGLTLNGSMKGGELSMSMSGVKGALKIDGTDLNISYDDKGELSMSTANVATTGQVLVNMDKITGEAGDIFIGKGNEASKLMEKYFTNVRFEDKKGVVADRNTVYYTSKLTDSASTDNGKAGLAMADESLLSYNPQNTNPTGDLAKVLEKLDEYVASGNKAGADELGASLAGASTAVLGMAAMGDVDRQLRAIRNRTTTMGVDQSVVNADMPYFNAWINAEGDSREMGEDGTLGGYKLNSYGGTVGFDVDIEPTLTAGMALTAMYGDLDATGTDKATGNLDSYYVSAFARYCGSAWTHTFVGTIGMGDISLDRTVGSAQVKGETDSMSFGLMYEVGRVYAMDEDGTTCLQPVFNVTWKHTTVDAYTEKGGDVALSVDEQSLDTITFGLGARLQTVVGESMYNRTSIFECRLLAKADAGDTEGTSKVALGSSATHEVKSNEMGAIGIEVGAGLTIPLGDEGSSIFMDASAEIRADYTDVNGTVGYRVNF